MSSGDEEESWRWNDQEGDSDGDTTGTDGSENAGGSGDGGGGGSGSGTGGGGRDGDSIGGGVLSRARWFLRTEEEWVVFVREVASTVGIVVLIGLVLFAVSGLWPPLVAVESGSMSPHLQRGDLVFVMDQHRFAGAAAHGDTGVVTFRAGAESDYKEFKEYGNVIVYRPYGSTSRTPVIHRARFWVNKGENWYGEANRAYVGSARNCEELANCPAPHAGFITKGDHNDLYDQVGEGYGYDPISSPVKPSWVVGTARFRIPYLGRIRLLFGMVSAHATPGTVASENATVPNATGGNATVPMAPTTATTPPTNATDTSRSVRPPTPGVGGVGSGAASVAG